MATPSDNTTNPPNSPPRTSAPTLPVEPHRRLPDEEIRIELCTIEDMPTIAEQLYICFPDSFWDRMEPPTPQRSSRAIRAQRLATRLAPSFHVPGVRWIKAIHTPTSAIVGVAGWMLPGVPVHNVWRHSATSFYHFDTLMNWSAADVDDMWRDVDIKLWDGYIGGNDDIRAELLRDEPHWFLAPLMTLPAFQGRGVASRLMGWAIEQADRAVPPQKMYLESAPTARNVYMRFGFEAVGESGFLRNGTGRDGEVGKDEVEVKAVERGG